MTEQKELEERVLELEKQAEERATQIERLYNLSVDMLGTAGFDGYFKTLNPAWEATLGYTVEELKSKPFIEFVHPDDIAVTNAEAAKLSQGVEAISFENRYLCKDGSYKWLSWNTRPDTEKQTLYFIARDISERKNTEDIMLQQSRLQQLLVDISAMYIRLPLDAVEKTIQNSLGQLGTFVGADRSYIFVYDFSNQICINTHEWCAEGIEPQIDELQAVPLASLPGWVETHSQGEPLYVPDVSSLPQGGTRDVLEPQDIKSLLTIPMMDADECVGFVGFDSVRQHHVYLEDEQQLLMLFARMLVNVRQRQEAETTLRKVAANLSSTLNATIDGILAINSQGEILFSNHRLAELWNISPDVLTGTIDDEWLAPILAYLLEPDAFMNEVLRLFDSTESSFHTLHFKDGRVFECYSSPMYMEEESSVSGRVWSFHDVTERKRAEEEHERLQEEIIAAHRRSIQELSTPVIPIMDHIIVMPLVGGIDSRRARDITRNLLAGISQNQAKIVILDVTGVDIMDTGIVNHLDKTIQAARLKGAQTIITGISDVVAESIVDLGIDWSNITTLSDLQTGLVTALSSLGVRLSK